MNSTLARLIKTGERHKLKFFSALFFMFLNGLSNTMPSWLVKVSIDGIAALEEGKNSFPVIPKQIQSWDFMPDLSLNPHTLHIVLPITIVSVVAFDSLFKFLYLYNVRQVGLNIVRDLRAKFHDHLNAMSLKTQSKYDSGSLVSVVTSDMHSLQSWLAESLTNMFNDGFKALFLGAWLLIIDWRLTLMSLIVLPVFAIPIVYTGKKIRSYSRRGQDYLGTLNSFLAEALYNQKIIKAFNLESWRQEKFVNESNTLFKYHKKWFFFMSLVSPLTNFIGSFGIAAILFLGLSSVAEGRISVGEFSSFFITAILIYEPLKRLGKVSTIIQSALGVGDRIFSILDEDRQETSEDTNKLSKLEQKLTGEIEFKDIHFSYNNNELFKGLNLQIKANSKTAFIGQSGGGKSTLVNLVPRFYELNQGSITIDGINTKDMSLKLLREQIAMVTQEPLLFTGNIRENIIVGNPDASEKELLKAAQDAHVMEFVKDLEHGFDTDIGERGQALSVGQRQRISLARAFISKSPIIILDEPTSALDNESQAYIQDSLEKLTQNRTVLIIAHRLSTVEICDQIVYIENGQIKEQGKHEELSQISSSAYASLLK